MPFQGFNFGGMTNRFQQARAQRTNAVQSAAPALAAQQSQVAALQGAVANAPGMPPPPAVAGAAQAVAQRQQAQFSDASNPAGGFADQAQTQVNSMASLVRNNQVAQNKPNPNCG